MKRVLRFIGKGFVKLGVTLLDKDGDGKIEVEEILLGALEVVKATK